MNWLMLYSVAANEGSDKQLRQNYLFLRKHIYTCCINLSLGPFAKLQKATISFVMSVRQSS